MSEYVRYVNDVLMIRCTIANEKKILHLKGKKINKTKGHVKSKMEQT